MGRNSFDPPAPVVPFFDIHQRSAVFHDSGSPAFSGVVQYNAAADKKHLQLIPSNSGTQPIQPAVFIDTYTTSSATITALNSPRTLPLNVTK
jgi:hypothetical protein